MSNKLLVSRKYIDIGVCVIPICSSAMPDDAYVTESLNKFNNI